jgi:Flp pilus assembly protein TadG
MKTILARFAQAKRGAVAVIFALTLVPMVLFVALAIDYSFFIEAKSQIQLAADAAVTHAIRTAAGTYSLEINAGIANSTAQADAVTAGQNAGQNWFTAQVGALPTAYLPPGLTYVEVDPTTNPAGFAAGVSYQGNYPPFFDGLFKSNATWYVKGLSIAQTQYSYVQIMMMLDTSRSMLLGATPADIQLMSQGTICMSTALVKTTAGDFPLMYNGTPNYYAPFTADANQVDVLNSPNETNGVCNAGYQQPNFNIGGNTGYRGAPCAFACHTDGNLASDGNYDDIYGQDRRLGATLRLDKVFQATEQVLQSMLSTESVANQYSVGLYQFNKDVSLLAPGTQGKTANGDPSQEATFNLNSVLQAVYAIDYSHAPETAFPPVDTVDDGNTNFGTSMNNFYKGNATGGTALTPAGSGVSTTAPLKNLFIVTDGMEDECCGGGRYMGEMTGSKVENGTSTTNLPAICKQFKNLGYTIYVLLIDYYPVPTLSYYYAPYASPTDGYLNDDYSTLQNTTERNMTLSMTTTTAATPLNSAYPGDSPDQTGLRACASSPANLFEATNSAQIAQYMSQMLKSALASAIRVTN